MIRKTQAFVASDGTVHASLEQAQEKELILILASACKDDDAFSQVNLGDVAGLILNQKDKLLDILTTGPRSRPPARKVNGGSKPRRAKLPAQDTPPLSKANMALAEGLLAAGCQHT